MNKTNKDILFEEHNNSNTLIVGLDSYKASLLLYKNHILNNLYLNKSSNINDITILITDDANLSNTVYAGCLEKKVSVEYFDLSNGFVYTNSYNPLYGDEDFIIDKLNYILFDIIESETLTDTEIFFRETNKTVLTNAIKVVKRLRGNDSILCDLDILLNNTGGEGRKMILSFSKLQPATPSIARENSDIAYWFLDDYYSGLSGERCATKTFEYSSNLRCIIKNLISTRELSRFLSPYMSYPVYSDEKYIIINLQSISNRVTKNFIINSILLDIFNKTKTKRKLIYSNIDLIRSKNNIFNKLVIDSKRINASFIFSNQEFYKYSDLFSEFTDKFLLSQTLSIKDYEYFGQLKGYHGLMDYYLEDDSAYINSNIFELSPKINANKIYKQIKQYKKYQFSNQIITPTKNETQDKYSQINELITSILCTLGNWSCFEDFKHLSVYHSLRGYLLELDIEEAKECTREIKLLCKRILMPTIEKSIKDDNGCVYGTEYDYLNTSCRLKSKAIQSIKPLKIQIEYLNIMLILIHKFNLNTFSCEREIRELLDRLFYKYYKELCVDNSITYQEIEERLQSRDIKLKKGIYYTLYKIDNNIIEDSEVLDEEENDSNTNKDSNMIINPSILDDENKEDDDVFNTLFIPLSDDDEDDI